MMVYSSTKVSIDIADPGRDLWTPEEDALDCLLETIQDAIKDIFLQAVQGSEILAKQKPMLTIDGVIVANSTEVT